MMTIGEQRRNYDNNNKYSDSVIVWQLIINKGERGDEKKQNIGNEILVVLVIIVVVVVVVAGEGEGEGRKKRIIKSRIKQCQQQGGYEQKGGKKTQMTKEEEFNVYQLK